MDNFNYKKYSLENLEKWIEDAINSSEASPQEIYYVIKKVVEENYYCYKNHTERCYELLALLNGNGHINKYEERLNSLFDKDNKLTCDKDDKSPECQKSWNDFWMEDSYIKESSQYSEETVDDGMLPWGHSDLEYLLANSVLTEDRISNFPGEQSVESQQDKVVKWQLPVEVDGLTGDCFIQFPDDLLEAANLKEGDQVEWIDLKNGNYELRKVNGTK
jgi:hypothetical protein